MKKLLLVSLCFLVLCMTQVFAQNRTVTGTVTAKEDGLPIPGATVKVKGTDVGVPTDVNGKFSISAPSGSTIVVSFISYLTQEIAVGNQRVINVALIASTKELNEVVVVGYGTKSIREINGSIGTVAGNKVASQPIESFDKGLVGKIAGVQVSSGGGTLGEATTIRIRGNNSIASSGRPLYVIDGVPVNGGENLSLFNSGQGTRLNPLTLINPDDIESFSVLKDAGAGAIYGSRAANGVILITTKQGSKNASISFDSKSSWASPSRRPNLLGADDFMTINNEKVKNRFGAATPDVAVNSDIDGDGQPDRTDWMKLIYKTGFQSDNNVAIKGGTDKSKFYGSARYADQQGIVYANRLRTAQVRINASSNPNKYIDGGISVAYTNIKNIGVLTDNYLAGETISGYNAFPTVAAYSPTASALQQGFNISNAGAKEGLGYLGLGNNTIAVGGTSLIGNRIYNPLAAAVLNRNNNSPEDVIGNAYLNIHPISGLTLTTKFGVDLQKNFEDQYSSPIVAGLGTSYGGLVQDYYNTRNQWDWQSYLTYDKTFAEKHRVTFTAGAEYQYNTYQQTYASAEGFADPFFTNIIDGAYSGIAPGQSTIDLASGGDLYSNGLESYFSRLGYTYDNKYSVEGAYRTDAFSGFGVNSRWGKFPSLSAGWVVSEEEFLKDNKLVNYLKIRGSYGKVGNSTGVGSYASRTLYSAGLYANGNSFTSSQVGDANLRWETQLKTDVGFNIALLNNRITVDADYFNSNINGLILAAPVLYTVGIPGSSVTTNIGTMRNRGAEITINTQNIRTKDVSWTTSFNYTYVKNKVIDLVAATGNGDITSNSTVASVGRPLGTYKLYNWAGVDPANGYAMWYAADGTIKEWNQVSQKYTLVGGGATTALTSTDQTYQEGKTGSPTWYGGIDNTVTYKNFDLNVSVTYAGGNYLYNTTYSGLLTNTFQNNDARIMNRWTTPGQITQTPRVYSLDNTANQASTRFLEKGNFARFKVIGIGYTFDKNMIKSIGLTNLRITAQVYNAFTISSYSGIDPEVSSLAYSSTRQTTNLSTGYDNRAVPQARTYTLGLNASF
jgi:TonB-linked SusC/RagA family outer membrane protein